MPARVTCFGSLVCPFCLRVELALHDAGLPHQIERVDFARLSDSDRALSPTGRFPVIQTEGRTLFDSGAIVEWVNEVSGGRYLPSAFAERAQVRALCATIDALHNALRGLFTAKTEALLQSAHAQCLRELRALERVGGPWSTTETSGVDSRSSLYISAFYLASVALSCGLLETAEYPLLNAVPQLKQVLEELEARHPSLSLAASRKAAVARFLLGVDSLLIAKAASRLTQIVGHDLGSVPEAQGAERYFAAKV